MTAVYILLGIIISLLIVIICISFITFLGYGEIQPAVLKAMHLKAELTKQQMQILEKKNGQ